MVKLQENLVPSHGPAASVEQRETGVANSGENLLKRVNTMLREYENKLRKLFEGKSALSGQVGQRELELMIKRQISRLVELKRNLEAKHGDLSKIQEHQRMNEIFSEAQNDAEKLYKQLEMVMELMVQNGKLTEEKAVKLKIILNALSKAKEDKDMETLLDKLLIHPEKLQEKDYDLLIGKIEPVNPDFNKADPLKVIEASKVGAALGVMNAEQRMEFVKRLLTDPAKKAEAPKIIDNLASTNILTIPQLQTLVDQNMISGPAGIALKQKISDGSFARQQKAVNDRYEQKAREMRGLLAGGSSGWGIFGNNQFEGAIKNVAAPMLLGLWSIVTIGANVSAGDTTGLYTMMGLAGFGVSAYKLAPAFFPEATEKVKKVFSERPSPSQFQANAKIEMKDMLKNNSYLNRFLLTGADQGKPGFDLVMKLKKSKIEKGQSSILTYQEIYNDPNMTGNHHTALNAALKAAGSEIALTNSLNKMFINAQIAEVKDFQQFSELDRQAKREQGIA